MSFRPYESARDKHACWRIWKEVGWIGDETEEMLDKPLVVGLARSRIEPKLETFDGKVVRPLGRKREQQALAQAEQPTHAKTPSGRMWRLFGPSGRGSTHSTAARSSGA